MFPIQMPRYLKEKRDISRSMLSPSHSPSTSEELLQDTAHVTFFCHNIQTQPAMAW